MWEEHQTRCCQMLSLDGGGIRAVFTASFLAALEDTTGIRVADCFDLLAGTSAGGLIALALGAGYEPSEILAFFQKRGLTIFSAQSKLARAVRFVRWIGKSKYDSSPLKECLRDYFGDRKLGDSVLRLVIPAYDSARGGIYIFKTPHHPDLRTDYRVPMWEVAYATAAAPTYFPAFISDSGVRLVDGGIWANNPAMVALAEGLGYLEWPQSSISLLRIAPPRSPITHSAKRASGGLFAWRDLMQFMMAGQTRAATNECLHILGEDRFLDVEAVVARESALDKLNEDLEGFGVTEARNCVNEISRRFLQHQPLPYRPCYQIEIGTAQEGRKGGEHDEQRR